MNVAVVGSCMIDYISYVEKLPREGETVHSHRFETGFGGKGANQCVAARKLGATTAFIARVGDDSKGSEYKDYLTSLGIHTHNVLITNGITTGVAQINVANDGANQIVISAGANTKLRPEDVENAKDTIANASVLLCQLETPVNVALKAIELCRNISILNGAPAITDPDPRLYTLPTIFCVNESEAALFTGMDTIKDISQGKSAIEILLDKGCKCVILTMGSQGVLYGTKNDPKPVHIRTPSVKSVDSTGAGDAFLGALAFFLAKDPFSLKECISGACIVAADTVTRSGTQTALPDAEILDKIDRNEMEKLWS